MSLKWVLISLWAVSLILCIGVYVQQDQTSLQDVKIWLGITSVATLVIVGGTKWKDARLKKQHLKGK